MDKAEFRVLSAMVKAGLKRKAKLDPVAHARRFGLEAELQARRYCNAFALWRKCSRKGCRRERACGGDAHACLKRAPGRLPQPMQSQARQEILDATPHNIARPNARRASACHAIFMSSHLSRAEAASAAQAGAAARLPADGAARMQRFHRYARRGAT